MLSLHVTKPLLSELEKFVNELSVEFRRASLGSFHILENTFIN